METPITITRRELLSVALEVQSQVRDSITPRCIPNTDTSTIQKLLQNTEIDDKCHASIPISFAQLPTPSRSIPDIPKPIETVLHLYLSTSDEIPDPALTSTTSILVTLSPDSDSSRTLTMTTNNTSDISLALEAPYCDNSSPSNTDVAPVPSHPYSKKYQFVALRNSSTAIWKPPDKLRIIRDIASKPFETIPTFNPNLLQFLLSSHSIQQYSNSFVKLDPGLIL